MREDDLVRSTYRRSSVHQTLGGGVVADLLLWKRCGASALVLVFASVGWFLFDRAGYNFLSFLANSTLILVVIVFFWSKSASLLHRPLPPLPSMEVSEDFAVKASKVARVWINRVFAVAQDIALARDFMIFLQVAFTLWLVSCIGSVFSFLSLVYIGVLLSLTVPALYNKYQDHINDKLSTAQKVLLNQFEKIDENVLRKIPRSTSKVKKDQ